MPTYDLVKQFKPLYATTRTPVVVSVPPRKILAVAGSGPPAGKQFADALGALYGVAFTVKFTLKLSTDGAKDFRVAPLEALWSFAGQRDWKRIQASKRDWRWTTFLPVPPFVTAADVAKAKEALRRRGKDTPLLPRLRLTTFKEGKAVQILHVGPYARERTSIERLHAFAKAEGLRLRGRHHEIYLSDPRRTAPARLKTILRHPVAP